MATHDTFQISLYCFKIPIFYHAGKSDTTILESNFSHPFYLKNVVSIADCIFFLFHLFIYLFVWFFTALSSETTAWKIVFDSNMTLMVVLKSY